MKYLLGASLLALAITLPSGLSAQEEEDKKDTYIYATYFYCKTSAFDALDAAMAEHTAPVYDAAAVSYTHLRAHETGVENS